ncbi:MAG: hypothetical protein WBE55_11225 [Candidatus Sulfotelmatobacter sp.]
MADQGEPKQLRENRGTMIASLANQYCLFFRTPDGVSYAEMKKNDGRREVMAMGSADYKNYLSALFFKQYGQAPSGQSINDGLAVLKGIAQFNAMESQVFVRLARSKGAIWLDLANENREIVKITASGWEVIRSKYPDKLFFVRPHGMYALPTPIMTNSSLHLLFKDFLNVQNRSDMQLILTWLAFTLQKNGAHPILNLIGEQGTAKSTLCRLLRNTVDPNKAPLTSSPRDLRDSVIAANNSAIIAYDNLSRIPDWLADAMCRMATGEGFRTRELWTDADEKIFSILRPQITNSIEDATYRGDWLDRSVRIMLRDIPDDRRLEDTKLQKQFSTAHPKILGALLTVVSEGMRRVPKVVLPQKPRMADFAVFGVAIEEVLGFGEGSFLSAYNKNRQQVNNLVVAANPLGWCLMTLLRDHKNSWKGSNSELLSSLNQILRGDTGDRIRVPRSWPSNTAELSGAIRRIAPALRKKGVSIVHERNEHARWIQVSYKPEGPKPVEGMTQ